MHLSSFIHLVV